jgi:phage terminase large subunit-like protein
MVRRQKDDFSFNGILNSVSEGLHKAVTRPSFHAYLPHEKQVRFHSMDKSGRLYIGGNRSGKTVGGIVEDCWWLTGKHPYLDTPPPPVRGRIVTVDYENGFELIIKPELLRWMPASEFINGSWYDSWDAQNKVLTLANGSTCEIMTYQQDLDKHAGTSRHFVHFDEEPPSSIYTENKMRLLDTGGYWWITMTPVEGYTWTRDTLFEPGINGSPNIGVITVEMSDNPYLSKESISDYLDGLDPDERKAREKGEYVQIGGLILKSFNPEIHVIPPVVPPRDWRWFASMDHGFNSPTAWLYHAMSPDGIIITFHEHYRSEMIIDDHAKAIHGFNKQFRRIPDRYVGDPAIRQRQAVTGKSIHKEYAQRGIAIAVSNNDVKIGIDQLNKHLKGGKWFITENCRNFIWEMRRYRWKTRATKKLQEKHGVYDEPHKKDDHAVDSARYFLINMPAPAAIDLDINKDMIKQQINALLAPGTPYDVLSKRVDPNLRASGQLVYDSDYEDFRNPNNRTEWTVIDEHLGGIF